MAADTASSTTRRSSSAKSSTPFTQDGCRVEGKADRGMVRVNLPVVGEFAFPASPDQLAFFGGIGLLAVAGLVEWPVAGVIVVGHILAANRNHQVLREFGEGLEQA